MSGRAILDDDRETHGWPGIRWRVAWAATRQKRLWRIGEVVVQAVRDLFIDNALQWAAAVAYYSLLSAFPLLLAGVSLAAFFVDPDWAVVQATGLLGEFVPQGQQQIAAIVRGAVEASGQVSLISLGALLWAGSRVFGALAEALNVAFDVTEQANFFKKLLLEAIMTLTIGVIFLLAMISGLVIDLLRQVLQILPVGQNLIFFLTQEAVRVGLLVLAFFLTYRFVPRGRRDSRAALIGAVVATALFLIARPIFVWYVDRFGRQNLIYGPLAVAIVFIFWAWLVALIALFGGELAAHVRVMLIEGQSAAEVERRHQERTPSGASVATEPPAPIVIQAPARPPVITAARSLVPVAVVAFASGALLTHLLGRGGRAAR